jgi:membrane-bound acyltransferase YfiQ involved in biofilm formation
MKKPANIVLSILLVVQLAFLSTHKDAVMTQWRWIELLTVEFCVQALWELNRNKIK